MTAKEAIETLKANYPDACYEQLREAVDAAIEAVKAQDVAGDTIYRQAAIDTVYKMLHDYFWADDEELDAAIATLNDLPPAQPEPSQVARDIATIIENEQDMRVILKNAQNDIIYCEDCRFRQKAPDWKHRQSFGESIWYFEKNRGLNFAETVELNDYCSSAKRRADGQ